LKTLQNKNDIPGFTFQFGSISLLIIEARQTSQAKID